MVPLMVELRSIPAIKALVNVLLSKEKQGECEVTSCLDTVICSLKEMSRELGE